MGIGTRARQRDLTAVPGDPATGGPATGRPGPPAESAGLSPRVLAYVVAALAIVVLVVLRELDLVADVPIWAFVLAIVLAGVLAVVVEPWHDAPHRSIRFQCRLGVHVVAVGAVIYLTGWGPALVMAFAFVAVEEVQMWGASLWRPVMCWSLGCVVVAQTFVWFGIAPSYFDRPRAEALGALGAFVLAMVIRMAGATGEKKESAEALLAHQALHDALTNLPNRSLFYSRTEDALARARADGTRVAVMLFDLDRFKEINDSLGHRYGDQVLIELGPRVRAVLRDRDTLARLGGDEFCVLLPGVTDEEEATVVANRVIRVIERPFEIEGVLLGIEASCGISLAPPGDADADTLLQRADVAMYVAKESASAVVVYRDDLDVGVPERLALLADLRRGVARGELVLHFQPISTMDPVRIVGVEALLRWDHPTLGRRDPDTFIPEAERSGLIEDITRWVLSEALAECRRWIDESPSVADVPTVAVNLSARNLLDPTLVATVRDALAAAAVPPHLLDLEITETTIMSDPARAREALTELAEMGITLSIDDFGTGYSSLAYLRDLPVHQLKIDGSFVRDMGAQNDDVVIVRAVVDLARNLGLRTIAEGVEDATVWRQLAALGCDRAQGYHLAHPMPGEALRQWLAERARSTAGAPPEEPGPRRPAGTSLGAP